MSLFKCCIECRYYADPYPEEERSDYWDGVRRHKAKCAADVPDIIMGHIKPAVPGGCNECWTMRMSGPCGIEGRYWEAKL